MKKAEEECLSAVIAATMQPTWQLLGHKDSLASLAPPVVQGCARCKTFTLTGPVEQSQVDSPGKLPHWWPLPQVGELAQDC